MTAPGMTATILSRRHPGTRCKPKPPPWHRRALASLRAFRQRRAVEDARDQAYVVKIEAHAPPPLAVAQARVTALFGALHHEHAGFGQPPAAVLPDEDVPGLEHLDEGQYGEWSTGQFRAVIEGAE